jgi:hypothetical protein
VNCVPAQPLPCSHLRLEPGFSSPALALPQSRVRRATAWQRPSSNAITINEQLWLRTTVLRLVLCRFFILHQRTRMTDSTQLLPPPSFRRGVHASRLTCLSVACTLYETMPSRPNPQAWRKMAPSSLALFRFIISSSLEEASTGMSAGFSPFRIRPVKMPAVRYETSILPP